jgi:hypothetical protein
MPVMDGWSFGEIPIIVMMPKTVDLYGEFICG